MVQVEAMACGTPVVNTNIDSAVPEVSVHGITGLTVPPKNAEELASAINLLLNNEELRKRCGAAGRVRAAKEYTADLMAERIEAVYADLGVPAQPRSTVPERPRFPCPSSWQG